MCGFIAGTKKILVEADIDVLLLEQVHRGVDGYGAIAMDARGNSKSIKSMKSKNVIEWIEELKGNPYVFLHHRATSVGGTKLELAHPLKYGETILCQNGTNKDPYWMVSEAESDSEALCMLADSLSPEDFSKYILDEVGVVIYRKDAKFYLHKDESRPLNEHENGLLCSEPLITGKWRKVKEGFYPISYAEEKLVGLEYGDFVEVTDVGNAIYCSTCKKRHLKPKGFSVCNTCMVSGKIQKKDYTRQSNIPYSCGDGYDDDYYDNWDNFQSRGGYTPKKLNTIYLLVTPTIVKPLEMEKVYGIPIRLDGNFYIVPGHSLDDVNAYYVKAEKLSSKDSRFFRGGYLPLGDEAPIELTADDFSPYWDNDEGVYDLMQDIYYETPPTLMPEDMDILVYDKFMESYIVPLTYNYIPGSYNVKCTNC